MKAVILAGGRGSRLSEFTKDKNKSMIELLGKPLIEYNLDHAVEAGVSEIIVVVCYRPKEIMDYYAEEYKGIKITYVVEKEGSGLVGAIKNARGEIGESDFILMLADEILIDTRMKEMVGKFRKEELLGVCGIVFEEDRYSIGKTYTAMVNEKGRAFRLIEKPKVKINNIKGTGHCVLKNEILDYIERTPINAIRGQKELVDLIQVAIDDSRKVNVFPVAKEYVNINIKEDYDLAKELIKRNNPKVLIVHNQMRYYGGAELLIVEMANWLTKMGVKNDILTLSTSQKVNSELINTEVLMPRHNVDLQPPGYKNTRDILNAIWVFRRKLSRIKDNYDVVNFHDFPVTWGLWPSRKPSVWFMNQPPSLWSKTDAGFFYKLLHRIRVVLDRIIIRETMDSICVLDELNKERAMERYGMNAKIVYCGVDYDFFSGGVGEKAVEKFDLKDRFVVVHSGILCDVKNQMDSIKAIEKVKTRIPNVLLVLTGREEEEYRKKLDNYVKKNGLEKHVLFAGYLKTREELRDLYKAADVGLFPIKAQGGWLAPYELLCSGNPIIVSSDMSSSSVTSANNLGIVTKDYAQGLLEVFENRERYKREAKKGAIFVRDNLSWKQFTERMLRGFRRAWVRWK